MDLSDQKQMTRQLRSFRTFLREKRAQRVLRGLLSTFLTGDAGKVDLIVNDSLQPKTDGKTIWVSLLPNLLDPKYEKYWGVFLRVAEAHEAEHVNSSDFLFFEEIRAWYRDEMVSQGFDGRIGETIAAEFLNATEDGRIEQIAVDSHPGLYAPFNAMNEVIREGCAISEIASEPTQEYRDFFGCCLSYAKTGRYPEGMEMYVGSKLEEIFFAVRNHIDAAVSGNAKECYESTKDLLYDAMPYLANLLKDSPELRKELSEQEITEEYSGCVGNGGNKPEQGNATAAGPSLRANVVKSRFAGVQEYGEAKVEMSSRQGSDCSFAKQEEGEGTDQTHGYTEEQLDAMAEAFERGVSLAKMQEHAEQEESNQQDGPEESEIEKLLESAYGNGRDGFTLRWPTIPGQPLPADIAHEARLLRKDLEKILASRRARSNGCRSGILDCKNLWQSTMSKNLFIRPGRKDLGSCVFYLLIDNSGSMDSIAYDGCTKSYAARRAASVVEEALRGLFPVKIALFDTNGHGAEHVCIKPFETKGKENFSYSSLSVYLPTGCNEDSAHIRIAAEELRKRPERNKYLFILSDGCPSAYCSQASAISEVRKAVDDATSSHIRVISILFGDSEFREQSAPFFREMYPKNLLSCDPKDIFRNLPLLFRNLIINC